MYHGKHRRPASRSRTAYRLAAPVLLAPLFVLPSGSQAAAVYGNPDELAVGEVTDLGGGSLYVGAVLDRLQVGDTPGVCQVTTPVGVIVAPLASGTGVTLNITADCQVIVEAITNNLSELDPSDDLSDLSPGAGQPALPETLDDATPDPDYLAGDDPAALLLEPTQLVTCKHRGWAKSTLLLYANTWFETTGSETRVETTWSSVGRNSCYGERVSNMTINTSNKYTYCYAAWWEFSRNDECKYNVSKNAPSWTAGNIWGDYNTDNSWYRLHTRNYASYSTRYSYKCWIDNGSAPSNSKLNCKGRQES